MNFGDILKFDRSNLRGDIYGGITAGIVALPLALALGVASGLGPTAGLYGAIFLGFFASFFGSTGPAVSGPTGPMVVVVAGIIASFPGQPELVFTVIMLAGLLQIIFGLLGFGEYIRLVPYPVISGFMSGIGVIIVILQIGRLLGGEPPGETLGALIYVPQAISAINPSAGIIGLVALTIAFSWPKSASKYLPAPLAALIVGTLLGLALPSAPVLGDIPTGLPSFHLPVFERGAMYLVSEAAFILAVLGSIDSLLTSLIVDNLTRSRHSSAQELIGQGIGNTITGFFGGVAGASATMRTLVNMRTGGKTRIAGMIHAILLLTIILGLGPLAAKIPHAALAGILVKVGYDIVDWSYLKNAHRGTRWDLLLMAIVLFLTVFADLITAVSVGVVLASLAYVQQVAQAQIKAVREYSPIADSPEEHDLLEQTGGRVAVFDFSGPFSFGAAADLGHYVREISHKRGTGVLILDFSRVPFLDASAARAVETIAHDAEHAGRRVFAAGMRREVQDLLTALDADHNISGRFERRIDALRAAAELLALENTEAGAS